MVKVRINDSTLREGEQTPGVSFTGAQKVAIARALADVGVDYIEAGHPAASPQIAQSVREIASLGLPAEILAHSRALRRDVDAAVETGADWVGIFFSVADARLEAQFRKDIDAAESLVRDVVAYAKSHGLRVRYTPEDTVRSDPQKVLRVARAAVESGADRIGIADTTGHMIPARTAAFVRWLRAELPPRVQLSIHCHDDLGMAVANSIAAVEAGADVVDTCVNGLGERTGIAALAPTLVALRLKLEAQNPWRLDALPAVSRLVEEHSGVPVSPQAPIVGANAFTHNAGLHVSAVLLSPEHYESIPAALVGRTRRIAAGKLASRDAIRYRLLALGLAKEEVSEREVELILAAVKRRNLADVDDETLRSLHAVAHLSREAHTPFAGGA
ncbi:MAG TPA: homocitrate synthase [Candidatus Thermoplasmatota archaeon]|nr:homocitrate synthase [Candidatus Thermoplasmatota archaeon]